MNSFISSNCDLQFLNLKILLNSNHQEIFPQVFEFLKRKDFVVDLLKHIGTSAISDLVLRLITCVDGTDIKQGWVRVSSCLCFGRIP